MLIVTNQTNFCNYRDMYTISIWGIIRMASIARESKYRIQKTTCLKSTQEHPTLSHSSWTWTWESHLFSLFALLVSLSFYTCLKQTWILLANIKWYVAIRAKVLLHSQHKFHTWELLESGCTGSVTCSCLWMWSESIAYSYSFIHGNNKEKLISSWN